MLPARFTEKRPAGRFSLSKTQIGAISMNSRKFFERFGFSYEHPGYLELRLGTERFTIGADLRVQIHADTDLARGLGEADACVWDQPAETKEQALALCVAYHFASALRAYLGEQKFEKMRRLNATEADRGICHSHDFCDANVCMDEGLSEFRVTPVGNKT